MLGTGQVAAEDRDTCAKRQGERSISACSRLIAQGQLDDGNRATIHMLRGMAYRGKGEYDRAIADFEEVIRLSQTFGSNDLTAAAHVVRASAYFLSGNFENALA